MTQQKKAQSTFLVVGAKTIVMLIRYSELTFISNFCLMSAGTLLS